MHWGKFLVISLEVEEYGFGYVSYRWTYSLVSAEVRVKIVDWKTHSPPSTFRKGPAMMAFVGSMCE